MGVTVFELSKLMVYFTISPVACPPFVVCLVRCPLSLTCIESVRFVYKEGLMVNFEHHHEDLQVYRN